MARPLALEDPEASHRAHSTQGRTAIGPRSNSLTLKLSCTPIDLPCTFFPAYNCISFQTIEGNQLAAIPGSVLSPFFFGLLRFGATSVSAVISRCIQSDFRALRYYHRSGGLVFVFFIFQFMFNAQLQCSENEYSRTLKATT